MHAAWSKEEGWSSYSGCQSVQASVKLPSVLLALPCSAPSWKEEWRQGGKEGGGEQAHLWALVSLKPMERQTGSHPNSIQISLGETYLAYFSLGFPISPPMLQ